MIHYPVEFEGKTESFPGISHPWEGFASSNNVTCAVPKEFDGPGGTFSPEDFFLLSIQNCFIGTFKVFAEYSKLDYGKLLVDSRLIVDKDESGKPWIKSVHLSIEVTDVKDEKKLRLLVNKTFEGGFILRSVKSTISHDLKIN